MDFLMEQAQDPIDRMPILSNLFYFALIGLTLKKP